MILEFLKPEPDVWNAVTVVLRAGYYVASIGAVGLAVFAIAFGQRLTFGENERLSLLIRLAVIVAVLLSLAAAVVRVQVLSAGDLSNLAVWEAMLRSRIGDAFLLRTAGLLLLLPLGFGARAGEGLAGAGAVLVLASYAAMGHSTLYSPRQELAGIVVVHLACVAFWIGSLAPLRWVAARGDRDALALIEDWSRVTLKVVALLVLVGVIGAALLLRQPGQLLTSWYGNAMLAKLALFAGVMALAAWHKLMLTPAMARGEPDAGRRLSRSILWEFGLIVLVFYAAAEMVSVHPVNLGHRIAP
jgi:putative copper export protein